MSDFHNKILKAISDYKLILRKTLPAVQCTTKMRTLGIKRKSMRGVDGVGLYKIGLKIIDDLKNNIIVNKNKKSANSYSGVKEFLQYLQELYTQYDIESNRVVHVGQKSSCALVDALQLISMAKGEFTKEMLHRIKRYGNIIDLYGNEEQKKMFFEAIGSGCSS